MKLKLTIFIFCIGLLACSKDKSVTVNGNITGCPVNTTCTYNYFEQADFNTAYQLISGGFKVFSYKSVNNNLCDAATSLYFKTTMSSSDFVINSSQIKAGQIVAYGFSCACCDFLAYRKPIGGEIKGTKTGTNSWLINATVIMGDANNKPTDTLVVNQHFYLSPKVSL
jgi:hypothetical protein